MFKTVAGMAILPDRADRARIAVNSLIHQVDHMEIAWQSKDVPLPKWLDRLAADIHWLIVRCTDNSRRGAEKFLSHEKYLSDTIWLGTDDDIEYPPGYAELTKNWLAATNYQLVSWHGRTAVKRPMESHYRDSQSYPCLGTVQALHSVDFVGSGVSAFLLGKLRLVARDFPIYDAEDITLSTAAFKRGMSSFVLPHPAGWIKYDHAAIPVEKTIWGYKHNDDGEVTEYANKLLAMKKGE
jgi:hypothetical protein